MKNYISTASIPLNDSFALSFDVNLHQNKEFIAFGVETIKRRVKSISDVSSFLSKIAQGVVIDNGINILKLSPNYILDGDLVCNVDDSNNNLFGLELVCYKENNKVYEEILHPESFDINKNLDVLVHNDKVYQYIPNKYIFRENKFFRHIIKFPVTGIVSFEKGKIKKEYFYDNDNLLNYSGKLRFILSNNGSTIDVAKITLTGYKNINSFFFSNPIKSAYIYLDFDEMEPIAYCSSNHDLMVIPLT